MNANSPTQPKCEKCGKNLVPDFTPAAPGVPRRIYLKPCPCLSDGLVTCPTCGGGGKVVDSAPKAPGGAA